MSPTSSSSPPDAAPLTADDLRTRCADPATADPDCACTTIAKPGWESIAAPAGEPLLRRLGTLRPPGDGDPGVEEHHPGGTRYWSAEAPIATVFFPYNRCEVWQCRACGRGCLQYTEYGGYYVDHRIRRIDPALVV